MRFPSVTFNVAGVSVSYPRFIVEFEASFTSGNRPFEFDVNDYLSIGPGLFTYDIDPRSEATVHNVELSGVFADEDGDGVADDDDACPASDLAATVVIDGCDSGVANALDATGCTISDLVAGIAAGAKNHGGFVSGVAHLLNDLKKSGVISGGDKGAIQRCAAQADLP